MPLINQEDLDFWTDNSYNVCLVGATGVGKTSIVLETWKNKGIKYKYFNGPTVDPFIEICGVPRVVNVDGEEKLRFIKPENLDYETIEAIFIDEANRCPKQVRNALMELILMKSVNGTPFPKLRMVWICVNPPVDGDIHYDSDEMDPSFVDRFEVKYEVPFDVDVEYFRNKYGKDIADSSCEWWREVPLDIRRKSLSPRRLDYMLKTFTLGGDLTHCTPKEANLSELLRRIDSGSILDQIKNTIKENNPVKSEKFVNNHFNRDVVMNYMKEDDEVENHFIKYLSAEYLVSYWSDKTTPIHVVGEGGANITIGPKVVEVGEHPKVQVLKLAETIAKNLNDDKFRERISVIFYKGKPNGIITKVRDDTHKALCALGTRLDAAPMDLMPPISYGGKLDLSHYIDKCMMINSIYGFIQDGRKSEMDSRDVNTTLSAISISGESKLSCLSKKYNAIKKEYGL